MNKIIVFGDIHGCDAAAESAVKLSEEIKAQAIFLGDYVDRGPSAVKTLRVLMAAKQIHPDWVFLRGNHDQMLLDLITGKASVTDFGSVLGMEFGYSQAAKSYEEWTELEQTEQNRIFDFLQETSFYYETSGFVFCHALLRDTQETVHQKSSEELIWNYSYSPLWEGKNFIHGHLPVKIPTITGRGININTSCGYGGYLTGLILETTEVKDIYSYILINEDGDLFKRATLSAR